MKNVLCAILLVSLAAYSALTLADPRPATLTPAATLPATTAPEVFPEYLSEDEPEGTPRIDLAFRCRDAKGDLLPFEPPHKHVSISRPGSAWGTGAAVTTGLRLAIGATEGEARLQMGAKYTIQCPGYLAVDFAVPNLAAPPKLTRLELLFVPAPPTALTPFPVKEIKGTLQGFTDDTVAGQRPWDHWLVAYYHDGREVHSAIDADGRFALRPAEPGGELVLLCREGWALYLAQVEGTDLILHYDPKTCPDPKTIRPIVVHYDPAALPAGQPLIGFFLNDHAKFPVMSSKAQGQATQFTVRLSPGTYNVRAFEDRAGVVHQTVLRKIAEIRADGPNELWLTEQPR